MKKRTLAVLGIIVFGAVILTSGVFFTVHQSTQALVLQFGNPVRMEREPGLKMKLPFVQNVVYYDKRILNLDPAVQEILLSDQKRINVDSYARYRIVDALEFRKKAVTTTNFQQIFGSRLLAAVRAEVGKALLGDMLTEKRAKIMDVITAELKEQAPQFGIEVVDVRIGRTDLPADTSQAVYNRMRSSRVAEAKVLRAEGAEIKDKIQSDADRQRTIILAEAQNKALALRGEGEGKRTRILAEAFGKDPEFFKFYRSLEAYEKAFNDTTLVISPDSEFFRFFGNSAGTKE